MLSPIVRFIFNKVDIIISTLVFKKFDYWYGGAHTVINYHAELKVRGILGVVFSLSRSCMTVVRFHL